VQAGQALHGVAGLGECNEGLGIEPLADVAAA